MGLFQHTFFAWLPIGVVATLILGLVHAAVQQNYRQSSTDPQIQIAEDAAAAITAGTQIDQVVPKTIVNINSSLAPWMAVYTESGVPLLSSGKLDGEIPRLPQGVFDRSTWRGYAAYRISVTIPTNETRFTWQPRADVRQAVVLVHFDSTNGVGYVAVGRSLRETEARASALAKMIALGWVVVMVASFVVVALVEWRRA